MASSLLRDREESERFDPFQDQEWQRFSACIRELGTKQALFFIVAGTSIVPFAPTRAMHDSRYSALTEVLQKLHLVNAQDATSPCLHLEQEQLFREAFDTFSLTLLLERVSDIRARSISVHTVPIEFIVKCVLVFAQALSDALDEKLHRRPATVSASCGDTGGTCGTGERAAAACG